ncbi:MAG: porin [Flavobacteriales bacterium]|nr:porin [Flavobacteriales bacterium]
MTTLRCLLLSLCIVAPATFAVAQNESDEEALINVSDGISIRKDPLFLLNLRFRMQNRMGFTTVSGDDLSVKSVDARVRRLRLRLDGFVKNDRIRYYIQLNFSRADLELENDVIAQPVRDAMVFYHFNKRLYIGIGQAKLPGNRERVISSGNLQFPDRSIANSAFTLDRDFGLFGYWTIPAGKQEVQIKGALSTGDGRGALPANEGMCYTGRLEWLPFGTFKNKGDYSEGDLEFEEKPRLSLGTTYAHNDRAVRTGGQLGLELFAPRDMTTFVADAMLKYKGWALLAEYFDRDSEGAITTDEDGSVRYITTGTGVNVQFSKCLRSNYEFALRYTKVDPAKQITTFRKRTEETLLGASKYLNGHRIKLQAYTGYRWTEGRMGLDHPGNNWTVLFQVEFGI